jgi:putative flippase GtrA
MPDSADRFARREDQILKRRDFCVAVSKNICYTEENYGGDPMAKNKEFLRVIKFTLFSISAGIIQLVSDTIMLEVLDFVPWVSYLISMVLSVLWNFTLNRKITFQSASNVPVAMAKVAAFYLVFAPLSTWVTKITTEAGWNEYLVLAMCMIANFVLEFLYQRFFVFKNSIDTAKK